MVKTRLLISIGLLAITAPLAMAQNSEPPAAGAQQPATAGEIKAIRAEIRKLEQDTRLEITKTLRGFGSVQDRQDGRLMRNDTGLDQRGTPLRDAAPVSATHQLQMEKLRALDARLAAAGARPGP